MQQVHFLLQLHATSYSNLTPLFYSDITPLSTPSSRYFLFQLHATSTPTSHHFLLQLRATFYSAPLSTPTSLQFYSNICVWIPQVSSFFRIPAIVHRNLLLIWAMLCLKSAHLALPLLFNQFHFLMIVAGWVNQGTVSQADRCLNNSFNYAKGGCHAVVDKTAYNNIAVSSTTSAVPVRLSYLAHRICLVEH